MGTVTKLRTIYHTEPTLDLPRQRAEFDRVMSEPSVDEQLRIARQEALDRGRIQGSIVMALVVIVALTVASFWTI